MENLIEPHRLTACMNCVVAVSRPMLSARKWYPEGRSHVLPLLNLALPGIDPNDFKKCLVTFQMISTFVAQVPIVDCSEAVFVRDDLTEVHLYVQVFCMKIMGTILFCSYVWNNFMLKSRNVMICFIIIGRKRVMFCNSTVWGFCCSVPWQVCNRMHLTSFLKNSVRYTNPVYLTLLL